MIKIKKVVITFILIFVLTSTVTASTILFSDIPENAWYKPSVDFVSQKGIMIGNNNLFRPDDFVSRAELSAVIERLYKSINMDNQQTIDAVAKVLPYCVSIYSGTGQGAGVCIGRGNVLTANHVVTKDEVEIAFANKDTVWGRVIRRSEKNDLAIVQMMSPHFTFDGVKIADKAKLAETVLAIGNPLSNPFTVSKGIVSCTDRILGIKRYIQFDTAVNPGSSGGPLFNLNGELVGIVVKKVQKDGAEGIGYAVPWDEVQEFIEKGR